MTSFVYLNGALTELRKAFISVQDRGFRFGDGVFETIRVYSGKPYRLPRHLARLSDGLGALGILADTQELPTLCDILLKENNTQDGILRIIVSRGAGGHGYLPSESSKPTVLIETSPLPPAPAAPIRLWQSSYEKVSMQSLPVHLKLCQGLNSTLARMGAERNDCQEAVLFNAEGHVCEGSASNIFWLKDNVLHTPALDCGVLAGITREAVIEFSPYPVREGFYDLGALAEAEAVVLTNSVWEIIAAETMLPQALRWNSTELQEILLKRLRADVSKLLA